MTILAFLAGVVPRMARKFFDLHHVSYARVGQETIEDVRILCRDCHAALHEAKAS